MTSSNIKINEIDENELIDIVSKIFVHMINKDYFLEIYQSAVILLLSVVCQEICL